MNNTFSIQRFGLLLKRQWLEFGKIYLISLLVTLGVLIAFYGFSLWPYLRLDVENFNERMLNFRLPLFLFFGFMFISIIASSYFAHLGQKPKAIIDLMIPASLFEKFLSSLFFTSILATLSFLLLFYLTDLAFISNLKSKYPNNADVIYFFDQYNPNTFKAIYFVPFLVTSIFLLGSVYFEKFHYIKTAISVMIFSGIWTAIIAKSSELLFEGKVYVGEERNFNHLKSNVEWWVVLVLVVLTLIFWGITYVRLKEKEV